MTLSLADQAELAEKAKKREEHAVERAAKVFGFLSHAANSDQPCPSNKVLRERFGLTDSGISRVLNFLEANGMIRVERGGGWRVVTIVASGNKTRK